MANKREGGSKTSRKTSGSAAGGTRARKPSVARAARVPTPRRKAAPAADPALPREADEELDAELVEPEVIEPVDVEPAGERPQARALLPLEEEEEPETEEEVEPGTAAAAELAFKPIT